MKTSITINEYDDENGLSWLRVSVLKSPEKAAIQYAVKYCTTNYRPFNKTTQSL